MNEEDLAACKIEVFTANGQHMNITPTGVKVTCEKYGLTAISANARSQHQNRKIALDMIEMGLLNKGLSK